MKFRIVLKMMVLFSIIGNSTIIAQDDDSAGVSTDQPKANKKFVLGLYIGSLIAN